MKKYENECVDCGLHCLGDACPHQNVLRLYCDKCKEEKPLYHYDGGEYCIDCIEDMLESVE